VRITRMRDVQLGIFDFDYDLTWMGFFVEPDGTVLGRYGGRDADSADGRLSLKGLRYALSAAVQTHRNWQKAPPADKPTFVSRKVADFPGSKRFAPGACIHCHQVQELQREALQARDDWSLEKLWIYPLPENVGLTLELERGNVVSRVAAKSAADSAGLRPGDVILRLDGYPIASFADTQYALHRHDGNKPVVAVVWQREGKEMTGKLELVDGWRKTDISWRWSLRRLEPSPWVHGDDLTPEEKKELGLSDKRLALRQGNFVTPPARDAGIKQNDVIIGVDGKELEMSGRQFSVYIKLNYKVGDKVTYNLLRDGKRVDVELTLVKRD
jgi:serine protease Do